MDNPSVSSIKSYYFYQKPTTLWIIQRCVRPSPTISIENKRFYYCSIGGFDQVQRFPSKTKEFVENPSVCSTKSNDFYQEPTILLLFHRCVRPSPTISSKNKEKFQTEIHGFKSRTFYSVLPDTLSVQVTTTELTIIHACI